MPSAQDPFYVVKEEIQESVSFLSIFFLCSVPPLSNKTFICSKVMFYFVPVIVSMWSLNFFVVIFASILI